MTAEIFNYFIHFELMAIVGIASMTYGMAKLLRIGRQDYFALAGISAVKIIFINTAFIYMDWILDMELVLVILIPLVTVIYIVGFNAFCMWKGNQDYIHCQIAGILIEVFCLITITFPYFVICSLLDPQWSEGMNSPFTWINAIALVVCTIIVIGGLRLLSKQMEKFAQIKFKRKLLWYVLCILYVSSGIIGHTTVDTRNAWKCIIYQIVLIACGGILLYSIAKVLERREAKRILRENKYLLEEKTLLIEYNEMVNAQVKYAEILLEETQKVREEIERANTKLKGKVELSEYMNELEELLKKVDISI